MRRFESRPLSARPLGRTDQGPVHVEGVVADEFVSLKLLAAELGLDRSNMRKYALKVGVKPHKRRTPDSAGQLTLAVTAAEAKFLRAKRRGTGVPGGVETRLHGGRGLLHHPTGSRTRSTSPQVRIRRRHPGSPSPTSNVSPDCPIAQDVAVSASLGGDRHRFAIGCRLQVDSE